MKYWISINTYLWKNIFNRWLESPLAPLSKVVLCFLLSLLSFVVIGLLKNAEEVLETQFNQREVLTSIVTIHDTSRQDEVIKLDKSLYREALFKKISPDNDLDYFRRAGIAAKDAQGKYYPIVVCFSEPTFWQEEWGEFERPEVYFFCDDTDAPEGDLVIGDFKFQPKRLPKVPLLATLAKGKGAVIVPYSLGRMLLTNGFSEMMVIRFNNIETMKSTHEKLEAYCAAENLNYSLFSALPLLMQLELFSKMQTYVRGGLAILIIIITAIVLGNQSLLEFREQQYQFALLRSFGSPLPLIMLAELMEKVLLSLFGVWLAYMSLEPLATMVSNFGADFAMVDIKVGAEDVRLILLGVLSGVIASWCFLVIVARKPVGLILS
jgi:hypothetical protein